ncbi:MAG: hypothetical protein QOH90_2001, partial [Actinomycetota bacterium]|nr:hypothetical protein [Actinomycetota bacterium]
DSIVTLTYANDESLASRILSSIKFTGDSSERKVRADRRMLSERVAPRAAGSEQAGPVTVVGKGFDACNAPTAETMHAWLESPYRSVGVYIGGSNRACDAQPNLTPDWVTTVTAEGWSLIPTYVGRQAPCHTRTDLIKIDPSVAATQGAEDADDAADQATALGFAAGSPVYFDMEHYNATTTNGCKEAVLAFLQGWTNELHARGFTSGVYSSASSGIAHLAQANDGTYVEPDTVWFAWWNDQADTVGTKYFPDDQWADHQRLHQYHGSHNETYGGVTINIDNDYLDGPVVGAATTPPPAAYTIARGGDAGVPVRDAPSESGATSGSPLADGTEISIDCQTTGDDVQGSTTWDHITAPSAGYVPDYYVDKSSAEPIDTCSPPEPVRTRHARSVAFSLASRTRLHLSGEVTVGDGSAICRRNVPVKIQRKRNDSSWATLRRVTTTRRGRFGIYLRKRSGRYRAVAPKTAIDNTTSVDICLTAASHSRSTLK